MKNLNKFSPAGYLYFILFFELILWSSIWCSPKIALEETVVDFGEIFVHESRDK